MLAAHLPLTKCTFTREDELDKFIEERNLESAAYSLAANLPPSLANSLPGEFHLDTAPEARARLAYRAISLHQEARSAELLRQELRVIQVVNRNYEDLVAAPEDVPLSQNARAHERLEIIDWLDNLCAWVSATPNAEQRMARHIRKWVMDRQQEFEERYC